jgi:hypothetical protein
MASSTVTGQSREDGLCVACRSAIPKDAGICAACKSYQRRWKNHLEYGARVATLIVLTISAGVWLFGRARDAFFYHEDVRVISANSLPSAVVENRGDGPVFVSHLILTMPGRSADWEAKRLDFEEVLEAGRFVRRDFPPARLQDKAASLRGLDAAAFNDFVKRAANGDSCLELAFFDASDGFLRDMRHMAGATLNTFPVGGYLEYRGHGERAPIQIQIRGSGVVRRATRPECR